MTRERIIEELLKKGYDAVPMTVHRNGLTLEAISIKGEILSPLIYTDELIFQAKYFNISLDEVVDKVIEIYNESKTKNFNVKEFFSKEYIKANIFIGIQKTTSEKIEKKNTFLKEIESYLYIKKEQEEGIYSAKITEDILNNIEFEKEELWKIAEENTLKETNIISMIDLMKELLKNDTDEELKEAICKMEDDSINKKMYVVTNKLRLRGASSILNNDILKEVSDKLETKKFVILPSSIHEIIVVPYFDDCEDYFDEMVTDVNKTNVSPLEQLVDRAYVIEL